MTGRTFSTRRLIGSTIGGFAICEHYQVILGWDMVCVHTINIGDKACFLHHETIGQLGGDNFVALDFERLRLRVK